MDSEVEKIPKVYVVADNILSPLGKTTHTNFEALKAGETSVKLHTDPAISVEPFFASLFDSDENFYEDGEHKYSL
jgi:3-oxoacyl-[acyl-carrier-protein] synthase-1